MVPDCFQDLSLDSSDLVFVAVVSNPEDPPNSGQARHQDLVAGEFGGDEDAGSNEQLLPGGGEFLAPCDRVIDEYGQSISPPVDSEPVHKHVH